MSLSFAVCSLLRALSQRDGRGCIHLSNLEPWGMGVVCHKEGVTCFSSHKGVLWTGANPQKIVPLNIMYKT